MRRWGLGWKKFTRRMGHARYNETTIRESLTMIPNTQSADLETALADAARTLRTASRVAVLTGAGVSAESGIPTFRQAQTGLWAQYDPFALATPDAFGRDPALVWRFYQSRRESVRDAKPNPGHHALATMEALPRFTEWTIITQNVDDLHEQAGSANVVRMHGRLSANKCSADCQGEDTMIDTATLPMPEDGMPPACPHCGAFVRPAVVWFGEILPSASVDHAYAAVRHAEVMLVIGTSGLVSTAANLAYEAKAHGAIIIEINPEDSGSTPIAEVWLQAPSGEVLPRLLALLEAT